LVAGALAVASNGAVTSTLAHPPETIDADAVHLRRVVLDDAAALADAVGQSLDHLRPWMPWATPAAATVRAQTRFLEDTTPRWEQGADYVYVMGAPGDPSVRGVIGLHRRIGPGAIEIGYWVHVAHAGRGLGLAAATAVTTAGLALPDVERVEIHTDEANVRSASIPARLGYRLNRVDLRDPQAPGETGRLQIWITP
jgi:RimJ/RimL family protein N-acetyltransferase